MPIENHNPKEHIPLLITGCAFTNKISQSIGINNIDTATG
jgi:hypothetical protein